MLVPLERQNVVVLGTKKMLAGSPGLVAGGGSRSVVVQRCKEKIFKVLRVLHRSKHSDVRHREEDCCKLDGLHCFIAYFCLMLNEVRCVVPATINTVKGIANNSKKEKCHHVCLHVFCRPGWRTVVP